MEYFGCQFCIVDQFVIGLLLYFFGKFFYCFDNELSKQEWILGFYMEFNFSFRKIVDIREIVFVFLLFFMKECS